MSWTDKIMTPGSVNLHTDIETFIRLISQKSVYIPADATLINKSKIIMTKVVSEKRVLYSESQVCQIVF